MAGAQKVLVTPRSKLEEELLSKRPFLGSLPGPAVPQALTPPMPLVLMSWVLFLFSFWTTVYVGVHHNLCNHFLLLMSPKLAIPVKWVGEVTRARESPL